MLTDPWNTCPKPNPIFLQIKGNVSDFKVCAKNYILPKKYYPNLIDFPHKYLNKIQTHLIKKPKTQRHKTCLKDFSKGGCVYINSPLLPPSGCMM